MEDIALKIGIWICKYLSFLKGYAVVQSACGNPRVLAYGMGVVLFIFFGVLYFLFIFPAKREELSSDGNYLISELELNTASFRKLQKYFKTILPDASARMRLLNAELEKYPNRSRLENLKSVIRRYHRDRGVFPV